MRDRIVRVDQLREELRGSLVGLEEWRSDAMELGVEYAPELRELATQLRKQARLLEHLAKGPQVEDPPELREHATRLMDLAEFLDDVPKGPQVDDPLPKGPPLNNVLPFRGADTGSN